MIQDASAAVPAGDVISSATAAKPAVLTLTAATCVVGDIVVPRATGWPSLDDRPFAVKLVAAEVVTLEDSDTTNEVNPFAASGATLEKPPLIELCRSTFNINNPAGATIDVTTLCDNAHKIVSGLPAVGTWAANGFYDISDKALFSARDYYRSGQIVALKATFRDGSGICFAGNVNLYDITTGINAAVANNLGGLISGLVSAFAGGANVLPVTMPAPPPNDRVMTA
jgi:hypothetical protein